MKQGAPQWLLALALVLFPLACLVLAVYLAYHPPQMRPELPDVERPAKVHQLPDFRAITQTPERKRAFFELLTPMAEWHNNRLKHIRRELEKMAKTLEEEDQLTRAQGTQLEQLGRHFRLSDQQMTDERQALQVLKRRADIIPLEMVLAQAAAESGWGTSRFARQGNNLFGQWCYTKGCGIVPGRRGEGKTHEVQRFETVNEAIATYYRNINSNRAYREVRAIRAAQRERGQAPTGMAMVEGLTRYSSRGQAYIEELKELIRYNKLERVHEQWLAPSQEHDQTKNED